MVSSPVFLVLTNMTSIFCSKFDSSVSNHAHKPQLQAKMMERSIYFMQKYQKCQWKFKKKT